MTFPAETAADPAASAAAALGDPMHLGEARMRDTASATGERAFGRPHTHDVTG